MTDLDGNIEYVNPGFTTLTGYAPNEVIGEHVDRLGGPPEREKERLWDTLRAGGEWRGEFGSRRKDGEPYWVSVTISPIRDPDGVITHFLGLNEDITQRKQAEEALRASEERYRLLYEDNPSMYFTVDTDGKVVSVNRFGAEQLGYEAEELIGRSVFDVFHVEDREAVREQLAVCPGTPGRVVRWELRKVRKDGSIMWVKETARAVRDAAGNPIILVVCEDITERKQAEEALQKAREELESTVERQMERGVAYGLTFRELTVLHLVAAGKPDKEIAGLLGISPRTAQTHVTNILRKMRASTRTEASVRAVREGLVS